MSISPILGNSNNNDCLSFLYCISLGDQHLQNISLIIDVYLNSKHYLMVKCVPFVFRRRNDNGDMSSPVYADLQAKLWKTSKGN